MHSIYIITPSLLALLQIVHHFKATSTSTEFLNVTASTSTDLGLVPVQTLRTHSVDLIAFFSITVLF